MNIQFNSLHLLVSKHESIIKMRADRSVYSKSNQGRSWGGSWKAVRSAKALWHLHVRLPGPRDEPAQRLVPPFLVAVGALVGTCLSPNTQRAGEQHPWVWHLRGGTRFSYHVLKWSLKDTRTGKKYLHQKWKQTPLSQHWNIFRNRSFQLFLPSSSSVNMSLCLLLDL